MGTTLDGAAAPEGGGVPAPQPRPSASRSAPSSSGKSKRKPRSSGLSGKARWLAQKRFVSHAARSVAEDERRRGQDGRAARHAAERLVTSRSVTGWAR